MKTNIKSIYVEHVGNIDVGAPTMGERRYDEIVYQWQDESYLCKVNGITETVYNRRYVVSVEYENIKEVDDVKF